MMFRGTAQSAMQQKADCLTFGPPVVEGRGQAAGPAPRSVAVIGAGFSGTIATLHLLKRLPPDQTVLLCERSSSLGRGVAYATDDDDHLLNVRAANMSAFAEEPLHFQDWISRRAAAGDRQEGLHDTASGIFASRRLYGLYLRSILDGALREAASDARLRLLPDEVTDILPLDGGGYAILSASGQQLHVGKVLLAVGNLPAEESDDPRICNDAWGEKARQPLTSDLPVVIVGTGLTMIDIALSLHRRNFAGGILALSRGGLLPQRHAPTKAWPTPSLTVAEAGSVGVLTARLRAEIRAAREQESDWRAVIDSLRPITARLWAGLPVAERARFLRHLRRIWDVHRHRMAPPHADRIDAMQADGSLTVAAGRIRRMESGPDSVRVTFAPRNGGEKTINAQRVIMASGVDHLSRTQNRLIQRLLVRGLVRLDPQGLGIEVTEDLNTIRADGTVTAGIWALGPIVRGVFWECVAVPDIRLQAYRVAAGIAGQ